MDADSPPPPQRRLNLQLPVRGMENVVATVTGYHGAERFNLIKLIDRSGANFVGYMNNSITHLVCWRYEGKKYELAKKLNIKVVNHQWIEACIKDGKRVPENPYIDKCGEEVGPLTLDISQFADKESCQDYSTSRSEKRIIDIDSEDSAPIRWTNPTLSNENEEPYFALRPRKKRKNTELGESSRRHHMLVMNNVKKKSSLTSPTPYSNHSRRQVIDELSDGTTSSGSPPNSVLLAKANKRSVSLGEREIYRGGRRLVKKNATLDKFISILDSEQEHNHAPILNKHGDCTTTHSSAQNHDREMGSRYSRDVLEEIQEVTGVTNAVDHEHHQVARSHSSFFSAELQGECSLPDGCSNEIEQSGQSPKSSEISCVICLAGVNQVRGLLSCGHWFCFECIYDWARACLDKRKPPRCPLCKASFESIRKYTHTSDNPDQKVYTQTSLPEHLGTDVWVSVDNQAPMFSANFCPYDQGAVSTNPLAGSVCCRCLQNELEDLLERCNVCQRLCVHVFCLDPPLFPWTCDGCKDLQTVHRRRLIF